MKNCKLGQVLGGKCREPQSGKWLREESCRTHDREKCSTFQVTVRLSLF